ncbi:hypothetical protein [Clostridium saccharoperbutylacetonicum]
MIFYIVDMMVWNIIYVLVVYSGQVYYIIICELGKLRITAL